MRRIALAAISTLAALIALFSYPTSTGQSGTTAAEAVSAAKVVTQPGTSSSSTTGQGPDPASGFTDDGAVETTRYGPMQVEVVITGGRITDVSALQYPNTGREDITINSRAIPLLKAQVLKAQSSKIDGVSGATFTSDGYVSSLQSALDAAGFGQ